MSSVIIAEPTPPPLQPKLKAEPKPEAKPNLKRKRNTLAAILVTENRLHNNKTIYRSTPSENYP